MDLKDLRVGCSGWSYADWSGSFYPKDAVPGDYLKLYSSIFNSVEIDSTYYRVPQAFMVANWRRVTPGGFLFTAKFPKKITHEAKLKNVEERLGWFYRSMGELKEKLGPLLVQLPPSFKFDKHKAQFETFLGHIQRDYRHAVEFRHASWFRPEVFEMLRQYNVALVWSENQYLSTPPEVTADFVYLRMVGDRSITKFDKKQKERGDLMEKWFDNLKEKSSLFREGFVFFNNHFAGFGPGSVNEFRRLAGLAEMEYPAEVAKERAEQSLLG